MLSSTLRMLPHQPRRWLAEAAGVPPPALAVPPVPLHWLSVPWFTAAAPALGLLLGISGGLALLGGYLVDTRVNKEVSVVVAQSAALNARLDGIIKEVDAKTAGLASSIIKEVDAKTAGLAISITKEVDAKTAGLAREVDAKVAGVIAAAALKAEAETLRVFKEYKVRGVVGVVKGARFPARGYWNSVPMELTPPSPLSHSHALC